MDIVEYLRKAEASAQFDDRLDDAADEIERLRGALADAEDVLRSVRSDFSDDCWQARRIDEALQEG